MEPGSVPEERDRYNYEMSESEVGNKKQISSPQNKDKCNYSEFGLDTLQGFKRACTHLPLIHPLVKLDNKSILVALCTHRLRRQKHKSNRTDEDPPAS